MKKYKGILLAGGAGTRLHPMTAIYSKQLITVYDKPMIYYPLSTMMMADVQDVLIVAGPETLPLYQKLFRDGSHLGMTIEYAVQPAPKGIAQALLIGEEFIGRDNCLLVLGDNIFYGYLDFLRDSMQKNTGATIFGYYVSDPERYGVVEFDRDGKVISLEEKPKKPKSSFAVPGIYVYNNDAVSITKSIKPSARGELEITAVNNEYLNRGQLHARRIGRGVAWLDSGTPKSLIEASTFIATVEERQGLKIGCIEEIALRRGFVNLKQFDELIRQMPACHYREYLRVVREEFESLPQERIDG